MALKLITAPADYPVTFAQAKEHLRVDASDDDSTLDIYLKAAVQQVEEWTGRALIDQTWELTLDEFPTNELRIPKPPLIEVVTVKYDDEIGDEYTLATTEYTVDTQSEPGWIVPATTWPATFAGINAVRIRYRAGYLDTSVSPEVQNVPFSIRAAVLLALGDSYAQRETIVIGQTLMQSKSMEYLLRPFRVQLGMA